tara:strand:- start:231 stop:938 length:708 start_codon:yes stop_codon:yes gene_type:complete
MALKKSQRSLRAWTKQKWRTKSGKKSSETGERYLPEKAIKALSSKEYAESTRKKREDTRKGKQHSKQSKKTARKVRKYRRVNFEGGKIKDVIGTQLYNLFRKGAEKLGINKKDINTAYEDSTQYLEEWHKKKYNKPIPYTFESKEKEKELNNAAEIFTHVLSSYRFGDSKLKRAALQTKDLTQAITHLDKNEYGDFINNKVGFLLKNKYPEDEQLAMLELEKMLNSKDERLYFMN